MRFCTLEDNSRVFFMWGVLMSDLKNKFMKCAIELAYRGEGGADPNPLVGAVIVKNGRIIGEGWHKRCGEAHAEVNAFNSLSESCEGAEMYVTLEPCAHYGKTPPCALAVVEHKLKKVYVGILDPNPKVAGKGIEIIKNAGIEVETGVLEDECRELNKIFLKYITTGLPYVHSKFAMSLDGKIACYTGESKWISCEESRAEVQKLRNKYMGIMVGINTVLADDPRLTCRLENGRHPYRIVVDSCLKIPLKSKVIGTDGKCIIGTISEDENKIKALEEMGVRIVKTKPENGKVELNELMQNLGVLGINGILLEGGGTLNFAALQSGIIDEVTAYIAPKIIGGSRAKTPFGGEGFAKIADCVELSGLNVINIGTDIVVNGKAVRNVHGNS